MRQLDRVILHSDMNGFYASVECLYHPELKDKPVAVCGSIEDRHGILLAKNEIAKKYGLRTGEAIWQAKQKCPSLVTVEPHYELYLRFSQSARKIYERYTDRIESFGLDECWLDVTGNTDYGSGGDIADNIRETIKSELGVTASIGASWNKIFAKLGSDLKKPDATTIISRENYKDKVWPLPCSDLLYVGPSTKRKLAGYGIRTIGDIAKANPENLKSLLGKWGETLWAFACGYDISPVAEMSESRTIKSIGNSMTTYRDIENYDDAWKVITLLTESVAQRLRKHGFRGRTIQLSLRDTNLAVFERQAKLDCPCCTVEEISRKAMDLLTANYDFKKPLRSMGVRVCDLVESSYTQLVFFEDGAKRERRERLESTVDDIRNRFGKESLQRAVLLSDDITHDDTPLTHTLMSYISNNMNT